MVGFGSVNLMNTALSLCNKSPVEILIAAIVTPGTLRVALCMV